MNTPPQPTDQPSGMKSGSGSMGELSDRGGSAGFPNGTTQTVSGGAASTPDRNAAGFENEI